MAAIMNALYGIAGVGALATVVLQGSTAPTAKSPPEIEVGKTVALDWDGKGLATGEIRQVDGDWVKLRVVKEEEKQGDKTLVVMGGYDVWVNFDRVSYYRAPRVKK